MFRFRVFSLQPDPRQRTLPLQSKLFPSVESTVLPDPGNEAKFGESF
jgi:hypothetical protein